jgi:hypothetical protein
LARLWRQVHDLLRLHAELAMDGLEAAVETRHEAPHH